MIYWRNGVQGKLTFRRNIGSDMNSLEQLIESKKNFRRRVRAMSPTEKIRQLELLQRRYYSILVDREANGGRPVPPKWLRWAEAQREIGFQK